MKYITAIFSAALIFVAVFVIAGLALALFAPKLADIQLAVGLVEGNLIGWIAFFLSAIAATMTFRASLHAKTGRLYRRKKYKQNDNQIGNR